MVATGLQKVQAKRSTDGSARFDRAVRVRPKTLRCFTSVQAVPLGGLGASMRVIAEYDDDGPRTLSCGSLSRVGKFGPVVWRRAVSGSRAT